MCKGGDKPKYNNRKGTNNVFLMNNHFKQIQKYLGERKKF